MSNCCNGAVNDPNNTNCSTPPLFPTAQVVQAVGESTTNVMSQNAVTLSFYSRNYYISGKAITSVVGGTATISILKKGDVVIYDSLGGYRYIEKGDYVVDNDRKLVLSNSPTVYEPVDLFNKYNTSTVYLYNMYMYENIVMQNEPLCQMWDNVFETNFDIFKDTGNNIYTSAIISGAIPVIPPETNSDPVWRKTDYIPIASNDLIILEAKADGDIKLVSFYTDTTESSELVTSRLVGNGTLTSKTLAVPIDAKYVRFCVREPSVSGYTLLIKILKSYSIDKIGYIQNSKRQYEVILKPAYWYDDLVTGYKYQDVSIDIVNDNTVATAYTTTELHNGAISPICNTFYKKVRVYSLGTITEKINIIINLN